MGVLLKGPMDFRDSSCQLPEQCATMAQILQDNGWSTFWLGKDHNVPETDLSAGASKSNGRFNRVSTVFMVLSVEKPTNGTPTWWKIIIILSHHIIPKKGYHLSKDLADQAIKMISDQKSANPSKPWFMWYCPGANHAPHQAQKNILTNTKVNLMKDMMPTVNGFFHG